jgi:vancomycin permeability regulator SanA
MLIKRLKQVATIFLGLGLNAVGVPADLQPYHRRSITWSTVREIPASLVALLDVIRRQPAPVLGEPIPLN